MFEVLHLNKFYYNYCTNTQSSLKERSVDLLHLHQIVLRLTSLLFYDPIQLSLLVTWTSIY